MEEQRAAFEAWAKSQPDMFLQVSSDKGLTWKYASCDPHKAAWRVWQAAIEHARKSQQPILSLDEARKRRCCRVCLGPDTASPELGVFVLNCGTEYAHEKCIGGD